MTEPQPPDVSEARRRLADFLAGRTADRVFAVPTPHPCRATGFCYCDAGALRLLWTYLRGVALAIALNLPFNGLKVWLLRRLGARIGKDVFISIGAWIDPLYTPLLTVEDEVFIGTGARIVLHEFRVDEFRVGKVILRRGSFVGGFSLIACGVEIGEDAVVGGGAVVATDVPPRTMATGNPAFIWKRRPDEPDAERPRG